jgi:hypothetical protein
MSSIGRRTTGAVVEFRIRTLNRNAANSTTDMTIVAIHTEARRTWNLKFEASTKGMKGEELSVAQESGADR